MSLVAQGFDGIELGCPPGRIERRQDRQARMDDDDGGDITRIDSQGNRERK